MAHHPEISPSPRSHNYCTAPKPCFPRTEHSGGQIRRNINFEVILVAILVFRGHLAFEAKSWVPSKLITKDIGLEWWNH